MTTVTDRGYADDLGVLGVLLDTDASTLDINRDVDSVGAKYEAILGQIDVETTTVKINDSEGNQLTYNNYRMVNLFGLKRITT